MGVRRFGDLSSCDHQERAGFLMFVRDHVGADEVYRLDSSDLRMAEILPDRPW